MPGIMSKENAMNINFQIAFSLQCNDEYTFYCVTFFFQQCFSSMFFPYWIIASARHYYYSCCCFVFPLKCCHSNDCAWKMWKKYCHHCFHFKYKSYCLLWTLFLSPGPAHSSEQRRTCCQKRIRMMNVECIWIWTARACLHLFNKKKMFTYKIINTRRDIEI